MKYTFRHFLIAFLLIATGLILLYRPAGHKSLPAGASPSPTMAPALRPAVLIIDFGDQKTSSYTQDTPATSSAFSLLLTVASRQDIPVTYREYSFGSLVESIGGLKNGPQKAWIYFVNGKSPEIGADNYILSPGDKVEWKYIRPEI
jgi:hypothetical protein